MSILADGLSWIIPLLVVLSVVVFVHEMGHFLVARWFGVTVEAFSIGFGPEIAGFTDRQGTKWRIAWIPLGGYVKFKGDENAASVPSHQDMTQLSAAEREGNFHDKPLYQRAAVVAAGPAANFLFAIVIFASLYMIAGKVIIEPRIRAIAPGSVAEQTGFKLGDVIIDIDGSQIRSFDEVLRVVTLSPNEPLSITVRRDGQPVTIEATPALVEREDHLGGKMAAGQLGISTFEPRVGQVTEGSPADQAGFRPGDLITEINGQKIFIFEDVVRFASENADKELSITVERNGQPVTLTATPRPIADNAGKDGKKIGRLGFAPYFNPEDRVVERQNPVSAISLSLTDTYFWMKMPFIFIGQLSDGTASGDQVRGIIGIAQLSRDVAMRSIFDLIPWIAIISISIGLINLFPIPILDGGHLLFYGIEAIRGRPLSEKTMDIGFRIGFVLVIMLMLFAIRNDVIHLLNQPG